MYGNGTFPPPFIFSNSMPTMLFLLLLLAKSNASPGATYDSIEGRFRIIKKDAAVLKEEIDSGARPEAPFRGKDTNSSTSTPKKVKPTTPKKDKTVPGRVSKSTNKTPTKKGGNSIKGIKEDSESSTSSFLSGTGLDGGEVVADGDGYWMAAGMMDGDRYFGMDEGVLGDGCGVDARLD